MNLTKNFLILIVLLSFYSVAHAFEFGRNLTVGENHLDVKELQILLNKEPDIKVAIVGPGSVGQETSYFGDLTRRAVIKFQEKYRSEVLTPIGLTQGTGYVGSLTRKKLNQIVSVSDQKKTNGTFFSNTKLKYLFPIKQSPGGSVILYGEGFDSKKETNIIFEGPTYVTFARASVITGTIMTFVLPADIEKGRHHILIETEDGFSRDDLDIDVI